MEIVMIKYLRPKWPYINNAINGSPDQRRELREELKSLTKKIEKKIEEKLKSDRDAEMLANLNALKALPQGSVIWYTGFHVPIIFKSGEKIKDGKKYMRVRIEEIVWRLPYKNIQAMPLSDDQVKEIRTNVRLRELLKAD